MTTKIAHLVSALKILALIVAVILLVGCGGGGGGGDATNGAVPVTGASSATAIDYSGATLNGTVIPDGLSTQAWFEYGLDPSLTGFNITSRQSIGSGLSAVPVSVQISGLAEHTVYYFRVCASNAKGESKGAVTSFSTSSSGFPPAVSTLAATSVGANAATLNGDVTPNGLSTDAWFEWGTDPVLSSFGSTASQPVGSGTISQSVNATLTGLVTGVTYYYRAAAGNGSGTSKGNISNFIPGAVPAVTTLAATSVGANAATLNGDVTPNGLSTDAWFEWGTDPVLSSFGSTASQPVGSGTVGQLATNGLTGLSTGTKYFYRIAATNSSGTARGNVLSFTPGAIPSVSTLSATSVGANAATLNGDVTPNGLSTETWFEWGTNADLSGHNTTASTSAGDGTSARTFSAPLAGLSPGATYYFRVAAGNVSGISRGSILQFMASDPPPSVTTFFDDFSTDTTGDYVVFTSLGTGTFSYNSSGKNAEVVTGNDEAVIFSKLLPAPKDYSGVFSLDFKPTGDYGSGGNLSVRVLDTPTTYYELSTKDASVKKVRKGVAVDSMAFPFTYSQGGTYPIRISFSPTVTTFEAFGGTVDLTKNDASNPIVYFEVESTQQDAYYDNIRLETAP
jgi:phosphodiesterase/alkaline phosphatase D-like protein